MNKEYDLYTPIYKDVEKIIDKAFKIEESPGMTIEELTGKGLLPGAPMKIKPEEVELFLDGLKRYFNNLGITTYESETRLPIFGKTRIIRFKKGLPKDEDITIGFVKQYGTKIDLLTFLKKPHEDKGEVNFLEKKNLELYPVSNTTNIDKISLYATTNSGSSYLIDISDGTLIIGDTVFWEIEKMDGEEILRLFIPIY